MIGEAGPRCGLKSQVLSADSITVSQRMDGRRRHTVSTATRMGTPMKAPVRPQSRLHRNTMNITAKGDIDKVDPVNTGSR